MWRHISKYKGFRGHNKYKGDLKILKYFPAKFMNVNGTYHHNQAQRNARGR